MVNSKLIAALAVVALAATANAGSGTSAGTSADAQSASQNTTRVSGDAVDMVKASQSLNTLSVSGEAVADRVADVLSSKAVAVQKGDGDASTQGTTNLRDGTSKDANSSLNGTTNASVNGVQSTKDSNSAKYARKATHAISQAAVKVGVALYNSFRISAAGTAQGVSDVASSKGNVSVDTAATTHDVAGELLSVKDIQKANKAKYKFLAMREALRGNWNQGIDFAMALNQFTAVGREIAPAFQAVDVPAAIDVAVALANGQKI